VAFGGVRFCAVFAVRPTPLCVLFVISVDLLADKVKSDSFSALKIDKLLSSTVLKQRLKEPPALCVR
jgi:hypothetical protein